jgi:hypothetical protein
MNLIGASMGKWWFIKSIGKLEIILF